MTQKVLVGEAIEELLDAFTRTPDVIPPDAMLERVRDDGSSAVISHNISASTRQRLNDLLVSLSRQRNRRVYMKEIVVHALRRKLAS